MRERKAILIALPFLLCVFTNSLFAKGPVTKASPDVVILQPADPAPPDAVMLSAIELKGDDLAAGCSYTEMLENIKVRAQGANANLVKITSHISKKEAKDCEHITAVFYKAANPHIFEKEFEWKSGRKLTWADFRGGIPQSANEYTAAATFCGIGFETNSVTPGVAPRVSVYNTFYTNQSWVRPDERTPAILVHEQGHFDICELYTRMLKDKIAHVGLDARNLKSVLEKIYNEVDNAYQSRQEAYERETQHGVDETKQQQWTLAIARELANEEIAVK